MKKFKISMGILAIFALLFTSCSKEEGSSPGDDPNVQSVDLTFGAALNDLVNRAAQVNKDHFSDIPDCSDTEPDYVELEIEYDGQADATTGVITIEILSDGTDYFTDYSELLKIPVADGESVAVTLNSFKVFNSAEELIWIAPFEAEDEQGLFDGYVDNALPLIFQVQDGTKPYINVEVLCYDNRMVNEYGYPFFDLVTGKLYPVCFFANYCPSPEGRHYVGNYAVDLYYFDGENRIQLYNSAETTADTDDTNNSADPKCLVIPESPFDDLDREYIFYVITPLDWPDYYGDIDNTPLAEVGLSWNDIDMYLNDDGETVEYIHLFIGCEPPVEDCPLSPEIDPDGDCIPNVGDCVGDECDNCPGEYNPNQEDSDDDKVGDACDNCPDKPNTDQMNSDDDSLGNVCDNCPTKDNENQDDYDGDGMGDVCDTCPEVAPENDNDGDCKPNNEDPCPDDASDNCEEPEEGQCGTAFMYSDDLRINEETNSNRWGWIEYYDEDGSITRDIYVGAGQNDLNKGTNIGSVTISRNGSMLDFDFTLNGDYEFSKLHIHVADTAEEATGVAKSPGRYNQNGILTGLEDQSLDILDDLADDFWVIVHADACDD